MNILQELYYGNINESERITKPNIEPSKNKELIAYDTLKSKLNEEQDKLFENFLELTLETQSEDLEDKYIQGFKTGLRVAIEAFNLKF